MENKMKERPDIDERPDHGHYAACHGLKTEIETHCKDIFFYTLIASIILIFFTLGCTVFPVISFIPSLFGENYEVGFIFTQITELLLIVLVAAFGYGERKYLNEVLFCLYLLIFIFSLFTGRRLGSALGAIYGACGAFISRRAFSDYSFYKKLKETEGFPHFSITYVESLSKPAFSSEYSREIYEKSRGYYDDDIKSAIPDRSYSAPAEEHMAGIPEPSYESPYRSSSGGGFMDELPTVLPTELMDEEDAFVPDTSSDHNDSTFSDEL